AGTGFAVSLLPWNSGVGVNPFWFGTRCQTNNTATNNGIVLEIFDTAGVFRFQIQQTGTNIFTVSKRTSGGALTSLGTFNPSLAANVQQKWDIFINDAVAGQFVVYVNGAASPVFNFSGDTTTDGSAHTYMNHALGNALSPNGSWLWSETIVSDSDTRSMSL